MLVTAAADAAQNLAIVTAATDAAQNLASQLTRWASLVIVPIAGIVVLPALFRRDIEHAIVVLVIVLIVGAFAFDAPGVQSLVTSVANAILGG